jgi:hypothetical protein
MFSSQIINEEDADGLSALEYAINKGTHVSVVKALQKANEEAWKDSRRATIAKEILRRKLLESEQILEAPLTVKPSELIKDMTPRTNLLKEYLAGDLEILKRTGSQRMLIQETLPRRRIFHRFTALHRRLSQLHLVKY